MKIKSLDILEYDALKDAVELTALVTNRLVYYHQAGFITDEEFFKLERTGTIESVTEYLNNVADKKLTEIREKNYESL